MRTLGVLLAALAVLLCCAPLRAETERVLDFSALVLIDPDGSMVVSETIAVQAVWDDGSGSEIVVYQPCKNPEATCASIKTIKKPKKRVDEPSPSTPAR